MQRFCLSALRRSSAGGVARLAVPFSHASPALVVPRREASSLESPATGSAEASRSPAKPSAAGATQAAPELDAEAAEQVRLAQELGEQAFSENTEILKKVAFRGLRAFVMCAVGVAAFMWAMKKKKRERQADALPGVEAPRAAHAEGHDDPTQRYLQEMRGLGFDVETLEEELEYERVAKAADSQKLAGRL
ncbi:conserved hypothetical protein [Leishmania infantum JPCM5]|uniref:Uncharacterized protein n=3 Tax=Leishmania donovani species complex TaxID=38574 RepID=A4IBG7_LEIIN|nr:conserved hypothetical protein [Leishmania infantum JPCM5]XP_003864841.1 hypothetical protein, conserved [Leishmania donovani]CAC9545055.1 hypothetical_protein_-_conserved [Leishmania infantum]AYU83061.1 hypothetical protein LdCL_350031100 [Leishmania donovani]TPP44528.1 hypothetical protein CGC21_6805 [Leishmania donovani]CAM72185.1 conserved hypothetical protein [Leishmania infantum JPCM5]CBZ38161.1 hypothetical protein, conserved [Leishmania donovani]|eukprot:XP_001469086.1 conserved hypothetical protein [Leishmania infantum JPCM5]